MTKNTIDIPDLPEGWEAVAYKVAIPNLEYTVTDDMKAILCPPEINYPTLIVQKTKPLRYVIEETDSIPTLGDNATHIKIHAMSDKWWRIVKEE